MKLFFASVAQMQANHLAAANARKVLLSKHFYRNVERVEAHVAVSEPTEVFIDSGAYSNWTQGKTIDLAEYTQYCLDVEKAFPHIKFTFANLDVIPGRYGIEPTSAELELSVKEGFQNLEYMKSKGVAAVHAFHIGEDFSVLHKLIETEPYFALGGIARASRAVRKQWLDKVFSITKASCKIHGFGVTDPEIMLRYPFYSVDSSSWVGAARFGGMTRLEGVKLKSLDHKSKASIERGWKAAASVPMTDDWARVRGSLKAYLELEQKITNIWAERGVVWE